MKWEIERSAEVAREIATRGELVRALAKHVADVLREHQVALPGLTYVFEPRVFRMEEKEALELAMRSPAAMVAALFEHAAGNPAAAAAAEVQLACLPECGGMDPRTLRILERIRFPDVVADDPVPIKTAYELMRRIVANREILSALSEGIFGLLQEHGVRLESGEGCVFTPVVARAPVYAQRLATAEAAMELRGFGPQVLADPTPEPALPGAVRARAGVVQIKEGVVAAIVARPWWWIGIPAPELLLTLDAMKAD